MKTVKIVITMLLIGVVTLVQAQQDIKKDDKKSSPAKKTMAGAKPKNVTPDKDKANTKVEKTENKTDDKAKKTPAEIKKDKIEKSDKTGDQKKMKEIKRPVAKPR